jgi:hypothetical protein
MILKEESLKANGHKKESHFRDESGFRLDLYTERTNILSS